MQTVVEATAQAPPEAVFAAATDIAGWPRFMSGIAEVELLTPGAVTAGTRFRETRAMFGRRASEEMTVAEMLPPQRLVLTAYNHGTAYRAEHSFQPEAGGTRIALKFEGRPVSLLARLFMPLGVVFMGTVKRQLQADLADLAREAERRHGSAGG
jgi:uncharacterized protein YndB with AHSA1/START domain